MKITTEQQLLDLYGQPSERAQKKSMTALDKHAKHFIETSPFIVLATYAKDGKMDASPRGGDSGFVKVLDDQTLLIPDAKGNNRLDSLKNILHTQNIAALFLIPGIDETLRLNGSAYISTEPKLLSQFPEERIVPKTCLVVKVEEVFLHCAKAFMRSKLWMEGAKIDRENFPTMGQMLRDQIGDSGRVESQEEMVERYKKDI